MCAYSSARPPRGGRPACARRLFASRGRVANVVGAACRLAYQQRARAPSRADDGAGERLAIRRSVYPVLGHDRADQLGRRHVERRVARSNRRGHLGGIALLDRDLGPARGREVDGRARRDDRERDVVMPRLHRERVRADLVGRVAVRGDPVGAREHGVDLTARHQRRGGRVDDDGVRDPGRSSSHAVSRGALEQRPRLVDPDVRATRAPTPRAARRPRCRTRRSRARRRCSG